MTEARAQAGYTLTEVMVVIAIIGIMAVISMPSLTKIMPRIKLNNDIMLLSNEIALARVRAISKSTDSRMVFDTAGESVKLEVWRNDPPGSATWKWVSLGTTQLQGTDLFSAAGFNVSQTLVASANGQVNVPLNSQAVVELRTKPRPGELLLRKQIVVEPTGRVFVQKWNGSSWVQD